MLQSALEVLQNHEDVALRDVVMGTVGWIWGPYESTPT